MNVKAAKVQSFPASIPHFPAETTFWSKFFHNTDVLEVFQSKISHETESRKILLFAALPFISLIFWYEILYAKYVDLLDKLKEFKNLNFFELELELELELGTEQRVAEYAESRNLWRIWMMGVLACRWKVGWVSSSGRWRTTKNLLQQLRCSRTTVELPSIYIKHLWSSAKSTNFLEEGKIQETKSRATYWKRGKQIEKRK
jgi:hypothetical protein